MTTYKGGGLFRKTFFALRSHNLTKQYFQTGILHHTGYSKYP